MSELPDGWIVANLDDVFAVFQDGRTLHQGWSPQCERAPSGSENEWGVLKTTAIQPASFLPEHNKRLPEHLAPRPQIEVFPGDLLITCAGPRARCGIACLVRGTRRRLMMSGKMYRFRMPEQHVSPRYMEFYLQTAQARLAIDVMKTGGFGAFLFRWRLGRNRSGSSLPSRRSSRGSMPEWVRWSAPDRTLNGCGPRFLRGLLPVTWWTPSHPAGEQLQSATLPRCQVE